MKPNFGELTALVDIAYRLGYVDWATRLQEEIQRLRSVFEDVKAAN